MENLKNWLDKKEEKKDDSQDSQVRCAKCKRMVDDIRPQQEGVGVCIECAVGPDKINEMEEHAHSGYIGEDGKFHCNWCPYVKE